MLAGSWQILGVGGRLWTDQGFGLSVAWLLSVGAWLLGLFGLLVLLSRPQRGSHFVGFLGCGGLLSRFWCWRFVGGHWGLGILLDGVGLELGLDCDWGFGVERLGVGFVCMGRGVLALRSVCVLFSLLLGICALSSSTVFLRCLFSVSSASILATSGCSNGCTCSSSVCIIQITNVVKAISKMLYRVEICCFGIPKNGYPLDTFRSR